MNTTMTNPFRLHQWREVQAKTIAESYRDRTDHVNIDELTLHYMTQSVLDALRHFDVRPGENK